MAKRHMLVMLVLSALAGCEEGPSSEPAGDPKPSFVQEDADGGTPTQASSGVARPGETEGYSPGELEPDELGTEKAAAASFVAMTLNIRYPSPGDGDDNTWAKRLPRLISVINLNAADIVGLQELEAPEFNDMYARLGNSWGFAWGDVNDEVLGIVWRGSKFDYLDHGQTVITNAQRDGHCTISDPEDDKDRGFNWVRLRDRSTGKAFYVYNTHFPSPNTGNSCERIGMAEILAHRMVDRAFPNDPAILLGDFNDGIKEDGTFNATYSTLLREISLVNTYRTLNTMTSSDQFATVLPSLAGHHWDKGDRNGRSIDFVFVTPNSFDIEASSIDRTLFDPIGQVVNCKTVSSGGRCTNSNVANGLSAYSDHWSVFSKLRMR